jgi:hypothetical protein
MKPPAKDEPRVQGALKPGMSLFVDGRDEIRLSDSEFRLFTDYLRGRCGLSFG